MKQKSQQRTREWRFHWKQYLKQRASHEPHRVKLLILTFDTCQPLQHDLLHHQVQKYFNSMFLASINSIVDSSNKLVFVSQTCVPKSLCNKEVHKMKTMCTLLRYSPVLVDTAFQNIIVFKLSNSKATWMFGNQIGRSRCCR